MQGRVLTKICLVLYDRSHHLHSMPTELHVCPGSLIQLHLFARQAIQIGLTDLITEIAIRKLPNPYIKY